MSNYYELNLPFAPKDSPFQVVGSGVMEIDECECSAFISAGGPKCWCGHHADEHDDTWPTDALEGKGHIGCRHNWFIMRSEENDKLKKAKLKQLEIKKKQVEIPNPWQEVEDE